MATKVFECICGNRILNPPYNGEAGCGRCSRKLVFRNGKCVEIKDGYKQK